MPGVRDDSICCPVPTGGLHRAFIYEPGFGCLWDGVEIRVDGSKAAMDDTWSQSMTVWVYWEAL